MKRIILAFLFVATAATAQVVEDDLITDLMADGFSLIGREVSIRGRVILEFESEHIEREIILDPKTGQILRDYYEPRDDTDDDESWWEYLLNPFDWDND